MEFSKALSLIRKDLKTSFTSKDVDKEIIVRYKEYCDDNVSFLQFQEYKNIIGVGINPCYEVINTYLRCKEANDKSFKLMADKIEEVADYLDEKNISCFSYIYFMSCFISLIKEEYNDKDFLNCEIEEVSWCNPNDYDYGYSKTSQIKESTFGYGRYKESLKNFDISEGKLVNYNGKSSYVIIPNFITEISEGAFKDNNKITTVFIPDSVKKIGNETFCNCKQLETVILGQGVTKLPNGCFVGCKLLKRINLENVIGIGDFCFKDCSLLADVHLNNIKKIGKWCFENCLNFKDFTFISQLTEIGDNAFEKCNIEYIALDKCEKLGAKAFANCDNLQRISISKKLKQIGDTPFRGCFNVKLLTVCEKQPKILYDRF